MLALLKISCLVTFAVIAAMPARAGERVALVIGNSAYASVAELTNPKNDAALIAKALRDAGFDSVTELGDLDQAALRRALRDFTATARGADTAVIYYAGHGVEVGGANYLVPVDAALGQATDVEFEAVPLDNLRTAVSGATKLRLVILDACRNNPFKLAAVDGKRSVGRGLARVEPNANELVAYAAREGTLASDGRGANSPYAAALASLIGKPGLEIRLMFGQVRDKVVAATSGEQEPFTYGTLGGEAIFLNASAAAASEPAADGGKQAGSDSLLSEAAAAWVAVQTTTSIAVLKAYIARYRDTVFGEMAAARLEELREDAPPPPKGETTVASKPPAEDNPVAAPRPETIDPDYAAVGKWAEGLAFDGRSLWVAESGQRTIAEVDPESGKVTRRVNVGRLPVGMEADSDGKVYSLLHTDKAVLVQAPGQAKAKRLIALKDCPQDIALTDTLVAVLTMKDCSSVDSRVLFHDRRSGKQSQTGWLGEWGQALTGGFGVVWVAHARHGVINAIDPASLATDDIVVDEASFWDLAVNSTRLFAGGRIGEDNAQGLVIAIDPDDRREVARQTMDQMINAIVADDQQVVAIGLEGKVWVLSAETLAIEREINLTTGGYRPSDAAIIGDRLFVVCQQCDGENGAVLSVTFR
jgi:uncharacterized caspase-like protein